MIDNDPGTEAERLSEWHEVEWGASMAWDEDDGVYLESEAMSREGARSQVQQSRQQTAQTRYAAAKAAKVGEQPQCGYCARPFRKTSYQQAFCCNKGSGNCKDSFHNRANPRGFGIFL